MRVLAALGVLLVILIAGAAAYAYAGFYNVAATDPHMDVVRWSLERIQDNAVRRHARQEVGQAPSLKSGEMVRIGGHHYVEEGCVQCHAGPGRSKSEFARNMRPEPPLLTRAASQWNDAELFWIMQNGIKMTGMPGFGPTHSEDELWAMVAFVRRLPEMSQTEFKELTAASGSTGHHAGGGGGERQRDGQGGRSENGDGHHGE